MSEISSQSEHKGGIRKKSFDSSPLLGQSIPGQTLTSTSFGNYPEWSNVNYCSTGTSNSYSLRSALQG